MIWVTVEDVIAVHSRIIKASGGLDGIRDRNSLEAAVNAPLQTFAGFDLFETDLAKIARICSPYCKSSKISWLSILYLLLHESYDNLNQIKHIGSRIGKTSIFYDTIVSQIN